MRNRERKAKMKKIWLHSTGLEGEGAPWLLTSTAARLLTWEMEVTEPASLAVPYSHLAPACSGLSTEEGSRKPGEVVKSFATRHTVSILDHLSCFICPALRWVFALEVLPEERELTYCLQNRDQARAKQLPLNVNQGRVRWEQELGGEGWMAALTTK